MSDLPVTVGIYTLGCKVNQYESEAIAECFCSHGFLVQSPSLPCDVYVINTCTVTAESDRKAGQFIRRAIRSNPSAYVLVTGCFSQTRPEAVANIDGVDYICGNANKLSVVDAALSLLKTGKKEPAPISKITPPDAFGFESMTIARFDRTRAYVKIEEGCENSCAYCIIPAARGKVRSKPPLEVLNEVQGLVASGCREIVLTGIETASYGRDLNGYDLADLLGEIDKIPGIGRIRLGSLDPSLMKQSFVDRIASLRCIAPHFHLSMQSASDRVLASMRRKYNCRIALEVMERLRRAFPNVQFTTDMIVGFPGETEADFCHSMEFVRQASLLMVHVFPYSKRAGTPAAEMPDQIPQSVKHDRVAKLSAVAQEVRSDILRSMIGTEAEVLFETYENGIAYGHTASFVEVACPSDVPLTAQIRPVRITDSNSTHCTGALLS